VQGGDRDHDQLASGKKVDDEDEGGALKSKEKMASNMCDWTSQAEFKA
jgi:hypothetical protein